jgi:hypothetical protein
MIGRFDPFIQNLHKMCRKDDIVTQRLIARSISWADVPSDDDDILELEGWRAYAEVEKRAKTAYHYTIRTQKRVMPRSTIKQVKPMGRIPYHIMKQEQTKHVLSEGRMMPVKEIVDMVVQSPIEYEEADVEFITTEAIKSLIQQSVEIQVHAAVHAKVETKVEAKVETKIEAKSETQLTKRHSKEKLKKKQVTPTIYDPTFTELYLLPLLPFMALLLLLVIVCTMKL